MLNFLLAFTGFASAFPRSEVLSPERDNVFLRFHFATVSMAVEAALSQPWLGVFSPHGRLGSERG
jgi:hypothetical protein